MPAGGLQGTKNELVEPFDGGLKLSSRTLSGFTSHC